MNNYVLVFVFRPIHMREMALSSVPLFDGIGREELDCWIKGFIYNYGCG